MGKITSIQWCHSTVNPTSGCDGCELFQPAPKSFTAEQIVEWLKKQPCYASQVHRNRLAHSFPENYAADFSEVRTIAGRMAQAAKYGLPTALENADKPWFVGRPRHIFISDMSDALSRDVSFEFLRDEIIGAVLSDKGRKHVWQWLTKRPEQMAEFCDWLAERQIDWPDNLWAGTSATNQRTFDERVMALMKVGAKVRFVSAEPMKQRITMKIFADLGTRINWLIIGGMSGTREFPFAIGWATSLIAECREYGIAPFVKQLGRTPVHNVQRERTNSNFAYSNPPRQEVMKLKDPHGGDWSEWPSDLRVRELPPQ